jgi:two-component system response regulator YesN
MAEKITDDTDEGVVPVALSRRAGSLEEDLVRRLALLDLQGARATAENLLHESLDRSQDCSHASYILYDVLSRVERVVAEYQGLPPRDIGGRLQIVSRFVSARSREALLAVFWSAFAAATEPLEALVPKGHPAVQQVKAFIRQNYSRKLTLTEIARAVRVSRNYLSHLFKRHCGLTVTDFLHRIRMKEAERLLLIGDHTVSEIAYLVGYQNYRDFHRNFVRYAKTSPKKYRQFTSLSRRPSATLPP